MRIKIPLFLIVLFLHCILGPYSVEAASDEDRLQSVERQLKDIKESGQFNNERLAAALAQFDQLKEEIAALRGEIETIRHELSSTSEERKSELQKMVYQVNRLDDRYVELKLAIQDLAEFKGKDADSKTEASRKLLYEEAFSELTQKNYQLAKKIFEQYLKKYPKGDLADNAQYWIGECMFAMGDYEKSILEFQKVVEKYPRGNKVPAAILKQGIAFMNLKAYADAQAFFELLIDKHGKTPEALHAKERLSEVKGLIKAAQN